MRRASWVTAFALALMLTAAQANAAVLSVTGSGVLIPPPPSALPSAISSDLYSVWDENQNVVLESSITVETASPGLHTGLESFPTTTLLAGNAYNSHMIHYDPVTSASGSATSATITFASAIVGIALRSASLYDTDGAFGPGTTYPVGPPGSPTETLDANGNKLTNGDDTRGIDKRANDTFTIAGNVLKVNFTANGAGFDQFRVFTAAVAGVPEPASLVVWSVLGAVVAGGSWWRRQRPAV